MGPRDSAYAGLKLNAVIDWIEVRVRLHGLTQYRHVQSRLSAAPEWSANAPFVGVLDKGGSSFVTFKVQDPAGPEDLLRRIQRAARPGTPSVTETDIEIVGVEIAIDLFSPISDRRLLADGALHVYRHHARPPAEEPGGHPRLCFGREGVGGGFRAAADIRDLRRALADGFTINAGPPDAQYRARYYVKRHDTIDGKRYEPLPVQQHRARIEVTLRGAEVPFRSIGDWRAFRFDKLASYFAMRQPVVPVVRADLIALARLLQARTLRFGMPASAARAAQHKRTNRAWTRADDAWARIARDALRALTRAQRRGVPRALPSGIWADFGEPMPDAP